MDQVSSLTFGPDERPSLLVALVIGVLVHNVVFIHGEWNRRGKWILLVHVAILMYLMIIRSSRTTMFGSLGTVLLDFMVYCIGLFGSTALYRVYFHRLRKFPGPSVARLTRFWHAKNIADGGAHLLMDRLHKKYGNFVRTGPAELTIFHPDVWPVIGDYKGVFKKPSSYDVMMGRYPGVHALRDKQLHDQRRRLWNQAFSVKALQSYQQYIRLHGEELRALIAEGCGQPVHVNDMMYWLAWDIMSQLAMSKPLDMLRNRNWRYTIELIRNGFAFLGPATSLPWIGIFLYDIPLIKPSRDFRAAEDRCVSQMKERIAQGTDLSDLASYLFRKSLEQNRLEKDLPLIHGDSIAVLIAGSDSVAHTMIHVLFHLAQDPSHLEKLRKEHAGVDLEDFRQLQALQHLQGVINEALRLHPAAPTAGVRETPHEGAMICGEWIPGNVTICAPRWTIGRLETCWEEPESFAPERWYSRPEMIRNKNAFAPFSLGSYNCPGKAFAYMEMQYTISMLVSNFDIRFAPGETGKRLLDEMKDHYLASGGPLNLIFEKRRQ